MSSNISVLAACCVVYVVSGGRWTFSLATLAIFAFLRTEKIDSRKKSLPISEVDFTNYTPDKVTVFPKRSRVAKRTRTSKVLKPKPKSVLTASISPSECQIYIFYTTLTGLSERRAKTLHETMKLASSEPRLLSLDDDVDDLEEYFMKVPQSDKPIIYLIVLPSYEMDSPIDYFIEHLKDTSQDFRVDKYPLSKLAGFAVLGLGDSESWPGAKFCSQAIAADYWMAKLGGRRLFPVGTVCVKHEGEAHSKQWIDGFARLMTDDEPFIHNAEVDDSDNEDVEVESDLVDLEELGVFKKPGAEPVKEMVSRDSPTYKLLTKQGYTIVGSHSGVKICRWTKSAMRGRGLCYKFAFYGIRSHLCMETTPSLACSNKCVFCWRHGTNPVAKLNWRWDIDPPAKIVEGALEGHYKKIKQMRGIPGIQMDRFNEAFQVKHCALSLVGEPIFYPHINELVGMLHDRGISSFLVCNAQHPDNLAQLARVTQLYVSIDAPTKQDLRKVDRPLNSDFWERLMACLDILRTTQSHQRTVFRLTLVKGFNMGDVASYADMVMRAEPSQIEVKGATFCGSSVANGNPLTMQNIPFYEECRQFVIELTKELRSRNANYEIAAEHAHLCCILIAHTRFKRNNTWYTHIDYPKFFELLASGDDFCDIDYVTETPAWAVWGSEEGGFNPQDVKYDRKAEKAKKREARELSKRNALAVNVTHDLEEPSVQIAVQ